MSYSLPQWTCPSDGRGPLVASIATNTPPVLGTTTTYVAITGLDRAGRGSPQNPTNALFGPGDGIIQGSYTGSGVGANNPAVSIAAVTDGLSNTLLLGEQPPGPSNDYRSITNYWNALN